MEQPMRITIKDFEDTEQLERLIRRKIEKLEQFFDHIISCHVLLEHTQKHQHRGKLINVHITLGLPGEELIVRHTENESAQIALRDAFADMFRRLKDYVHKLQGEVKQHAETLQGTVLRLFDDFGFISGPDGTEYYFNAGHVVHTHFKKLAVDKTVRFIPVAGKDGMQAHRVSLSD